MSRQKLAAIKCDHEEKIEAETEEEEKTRSLWSKHSYVKKRQNFVLIFGCAPGYTVKAKTKMIQEISDIMLKKFEKINFSLTIPNVFDDMYSGDATFEMSASNTI